MSEENASKELSEDKLKEVSGGREYVVRRENRILEYWYVCSACGEYKELVYSGRGGVRVDLHGDIACPKCGFTGSFSVHVG